jgi:hypothetical protein
VLSVAVYRVSIPVRLPFWQAILREASMGRVAWIAAGVVTAALITIVINLVTSGGAWWLWPILVALVAAAILAEAMRGRRPDAPTGDSQEIIASNAMVEGSAQLAEGRGTTVSQKIIARRKAKVRNSPQTHRQK